MPPSPPAKDDGPLSPVSHKRGGASAVRKKSTKEHDFSFESVGAQLDLSREQEWDAFSKDITVVQLRGELAQVKERLEEALLDKTHADERALKLQSDLQIAGRHNEIKQQGMIDLQSSSDRDLAEAKAETKRLQSMYETLQVELKREKVDRRSDASQASMVLSKELQSTQILKAAAMRSDSQLRKTTDKLKETEKTLKETHTKLQYSEESRVELEVQKQEYMDLVKATEAKAEREKIKGFAEGARSTRDELEPQISELKLRLQFEEDRTQSRTDDLADEIEKSKRATEAEEEAKRAKIEAETAMAAAQEEAGMLAKLSRSLAEAKNLAESRFEASQGACHEAALRTSRLKEELTAATEETESLKAALARCDLDRIEYEAIISTQGKVSQGLADRTAETIYKLEGELKELSEQLETAREFEYKARESSLTSQELELRLREEQLKIDSVVQDLTHAQVPTLYSGYSCYSQS